MSAALGRWFYAGARPNRVARVLNECSARMYGLGIRPRRLVTLQVRGRRTGRLISFPLVMVDVGGERYLVSMLGERANWVHNLRAAGGNAVLRHGCREEVHVEEVEPAARPPILRRYLERAPGARPHLAVDRHDSLVAFDLVAARHPVFRLPRPPVVAHRFLIALLRSPLAERACGRRHGQVASTDPLLIVDLDTTPLQVWPARASRVVGASCTGRRRSRR